MCILSAFLMIQLVKNLPAMQETACYIVDLGSIPELERSPGGGNGNPFQYSYLGNPMDRGAWQGTVHGIQRVRHNLTTPKCIF